MHCLFWRFICFCTLILSSQGLIAQLAIDKTQQFRPGESFKRVFVTMEDHTVWALNSQGKVYYKKQSETDFSIYPQTSSLIITAISGFNTNDMYFLETSSKLVWIKNGVSHAIAIPFAGAIKLNDIAVIYKKYATITISPTAKTQSDILSIATDRCLYFLERGQTNLKQYQYDTREPLDGFPDWRINHSGYKFVDFSYKYPSGGLCIDADRVNMNFIGGTAFVYHLPDKGTYPSKINTSMFALQVLSPIVYSTYTSRLNFWGTDDGLYIKPVFSCTDNTIRKVLPGTVINAIESIYGLTPIYKQEFVFIATNQGIYYTPASIFGEFYEDPGDFNKIDFVPVSGTSGLKFNSLSTDTHEFGVNQLFGAFPRPILCENEIWAASETGIYRLATTIDKEYYKKYDFIETGLSTTPIIGNQVIPILEIMPGQNLNMNVRIMDDWGQLRVQWFKNDIEVPEWEGKRTVVLTEAATYYIKVTLLCENIVLSSKPITAKKLAGPEITFNYPAELDFCKSQPLTLSTISKPGYSFRWFKDNVQISNSSALHTVTERGIYRVEVSNVPGIYVSSGSVKVNQIVITKPVIKSAKNTFCVGETASLSVENATGYIVKWFRNGVEIASSKNQNLLSTNESGNYTVIFANTTGCAESSESFLLSFVPLPTFTISSNKSTTICYGETVLLTSTQSGAAYKWSTGETTESISVKTAGKYSLELTNSNGCLQTNSIDITFRDPLELIEPEEETICTVAGEHIVLKAASVFKSYLWNGKKGSAELEISVPGEYLLEVEDFNGCRATSNYKVVAFCRDIIIPNTFSPNGDGINDKWNIGGLERDRGARIVVFNRYGNIVFQSIGPNHSWDGISSGNNVPDGSYYYIVKTNQSAQILRGSVTIIR